MKHLVVALCMLSACILGGCTTRDPLDDVSMVSPADRPALQKCLATPDLPGNQWTPRAGKARCWLALPQEPSLHEIAQTLQKPGGGMALDQRYAKILAEHYDDPAHRDFLFAAYQSFDTEEGRKLAADWFAKSPNSPYAQLAQAEAALAQAWKARGNAFASETTDKQFEGMTAQLRTAVPLLQSALQIDAKLSPACVDLMQIGAMSSDESLLVPATRECMRTDPLSWHVNNQWLRDIDPRWGGSLDEIDAAIKQIGQHVKDSPMLGSLLAKGIGSRVLHDYKSPDLTPIAPELDRAALAAPDPNYLDKAGLAAEEGNNTRKALDYMSQALRYSPYNKDFLIDHVAVLRKMGNINEALREARLVDTLLDEDCGCHDYSYLARFFGERNLVNDQRVALQKAMHSKDNHTWALTVFCQTYISDDDADRVQMLSCTKQLATESPEDPEAMYLRALALYIAHDPAAAEFDARFRKLADPKDNNRQFELQQLDKLKDHPEH